MSYHDWVTGTHVDLRTFRLESLGSFCLIHYFPWIFVSDSYKSEVNSVELSQLLRKIKIICAWSLAHRLNKLNQLLKKQWLPVRKHALLWVLAAGWRTILTQPWMSRSVRFAVPPCCPFSVAVGVCGGGYSFATADIAKYHKLNSSSNRHSSGG